MVHINLIRDPSVVVIEQNTSLSLTEPSYRSTQYPISGRSIQRVLHVVHAQNDFSVILDVWLLSIIAILDFQKSSHF